MRPQGEVGTVTVRRFVKMAILIALVPAVTGCQRPQATPGAPPGFQSIAGRPVEYSFPHKGGNLPVEIRVDASPPGSVGFNVYTDQQWRELKAGAAPVAPVGLGTAVPDQPSALIWQGSSPFAGFYRVQVFSIAQPASFKIAVSGPGAGGSTSGATYSAAITSPQADATSPSEPSAASLEPTADVASLQAGNGTSRASPARKATPGAAPAHVTPARPAITASPTVQPTSQEPQLALTGTGNFNAISDQAMEFDFYYPGGNVPVDVIVEARPPGSVEFSVYTDRQWNLFAGGDLAIPPIGKGTVNPNAPGSLFWRGVSASPGLYHVRVFRQAQPASFWIDLNGAGELIARSPAVAEP